MGLNWLQSNLQSHSLLSSSVYTRLYNSNHQPQKHGKTPKPKNTAAKIRDNFSLPPDNDKNLHVQINCAKTKPNLPTEKGDNRTKDKRKEFQIPAPAINVYMTNMTLEHLGRHDMISWVNDILGTNFTNVEELGSGAAYCQFMDLLFPGSISMKKVKFQTSFEQDCVDNFDLLQATFHQLKVDKIIPVDKILKGRFLDNFQFLLWFKKFFMANYKGTRYNAIEARFGIPFGVQVKTSDVIWQNLVVIPNSNKPSSLTKVSPQIQNGGHGHVQVQVQGTRQSCPRGKIDTKKDCRYCMGQWWSQ